VPSTKDDGDVHKDIERIVPLGLTHDQAKAWFRHDVIQPLLARAVLALILSSAIVIVMVTPTAEYFESTLTMHMVVQHLLLIIAGFLSAYALDLLILVESRFSEGVSKSYALLLRVNVDYNKRGVIAFVFAGLLTAYWHIPNNFDAAVLNEAVHMQMHFAFLVVGGLIFLGSKLLTRRMRHIAPIVAGKAMGLFGTFLLFTPSYVYDAYPAREQSETGLVMVIMMLAMDLTLVPYWLYNYFRKGSPSAVES